jgi:hypothetical protein
MRFCSPDVDGQPSDEIQRLMLLWTGFGLSGHSYVPAQACDAVKLRMHRLGKLSSQGL